MWFQCQGPTCTNWLTWRNEWPWCFRDTQLYWLILPNICWMQLILIPFIVNANLIQLTVRTGKTCARLVGSGYRKSSLLEDEGIKPWAQQWANFNWKSTQNDNAKVGNLGKPMEYVPTILRVLRKLHKICIHCWFLNNPADAFLGTFSSAKSAPLQKIIIFDHFWCKCWYSC